MNRNELRERMFQAFDAAAPKLDGEVREAFLWILLGMYVDSRDHDQSHMNKTLLIVTRLCDPDRWKPGAAGRIIMVGEGVRRMLEPDMPAEWRSMFEEARQWAGRRR